MDSALWVPTEEYIQKTNIAKFMAEFNIKSVKEFHAWTVTHYEKFWQHIIAKLDIQFHTKPQKICDLSKGIELPQWLWGAKLNIVDSCLSAAPTQTAIISRSEDETMQQLSYAELGKLTNRVANSLKKIGMKAGDAIAITMPMTMEAVVIYLGIIKIGGIVISIADSFSPEEIATRLRITHTQAIFTQDCIVRDAKKIPLYTKILTANAPLAIVLPGTKTIEVTLRCNDISWEKFLVADTSFNSHCCDPMAHCNVLFSSGTTGDPKAIPWNHTTAIKAASDAFFHQNIQKNDILAWPTNLGWMMGPWLIFAAFINRATIALFNGVPTKRPFGKFIQDAKVTMLGVVPTLVAAWRQSRCMEGLEWGTIKVFSSTGECSNAADMLYLSSLAGHKPIIEYCGGTEIGGAYITSTVIEKNYPSVFTTPAMGLDFVILNDAGHPDDNGEVALIPPSMGLSTELLNADHHEIYFANMPKLANGKVLRRHGDQVCRLPNGNYCELGRVDDTMKLSGIKVSSAEIERALVGIENIIETAAVAINSQQGPSSLVIFAATQQELSKEIIKKQMQDRINKRLNPLFKIYDVIFIKELPKTASNKIMRRMLRKRYHDT